ncbi:MAG TPA: hypothetical protein VG839_04725 [Asticcacaulis sp.]|nr:hypothetical protein [Asticcacaulis sp.]
MAEILKPANQTEVDAYIAAYHGKICWQAVKNFGSMLCLDFGQPLAIQGRSGPITKGERRVVVYNCFWELSSPPVFVSSDDDLSRFESQYQSLFLGSSLNRLVFSDYYLVFQFSNGTTLKADASNRYKTSSSLLELDNLWGSYLTLLPDGDLVIGT